LNQAEASAIQNGSLKEPNLDQQLVHNEQTSVQGQLDSLKQSDPNAYNKTVTEINGALNPGSLGKEAASVFSTDKAFQGVQQASLTPVATPSHIHTIMLDRRPQRRTSATR
jgi:hypothetical protein